MVRDRWMDRWTDGWIEERTEKVTIDVGAPPKNKRAKITYHETIQWCCENDCKQMSNNYFLCLLSILLSMQDSTLLL